MSESEPCRPKAGKAFSIQGNTIDRDAKQNGSGISADVAHTLDSADRHGVMAAGFSFGQSAKARSIGYAEEQSTTLTGGEGGNNKQVIMAVDCRNSTENPDVNGTLQAKDGGGTSINLNNVVRTSGGAMNPWDAQSARIYGSEGSWHSLNANENGGQSRDAVLVES